MRDTEDAQRRRKRPVIEVEPSAEPGDVTEPSEGKKEPRMGRGLLSFDVQPQFLLKLDGKPITATDRKLPYGTYTVGVVDPDTGRRKFFKVSLNAESPAATIRFK